MLLGKVYAGGKETESAIKSFEKSIELNPALPGTYMAISQIYIGSRKFDEALARFEEALKANPNSLNTLLL